jgi:hypothetical protein
MITDWTGELGLAAIAAMGWPELECKSGASGSRITRRLKLNEYLDPYDPKLFGLVLGYYSGERWTECGGSSWDTILDDVTLAILRDHAINWLQATYRNFAIEWLAGDVILSHMPEGSHGRIFLTFAFQPLDQALISAIEAAEDGAK